jgi:hypothetical protein
MKSVALHAPNGSPPPAAGARRTFRRVLVPAFLVALLGLSGYVHGVWTGRWAHSHELESALARLDRVPHRFGDWQGTDLDLDARQVRLGGMDGFVHRRYENPKTGHAVVVLLACGRAGPIAVHTPDGCYGGAGYALNKSPARHAVAAAGRGPAAEFWTARFTRRKGALASQLRIYWTWGSKGAWQAPDNPRFHFAGARALYKLYVIQELNHADEQLDEASCQGFLRALLPELDRALGAAP